MCFMGFRSLQAPRCFLTAPRRVLISSEAIWALKAIMTTLSVPHSSANFYGAPEGVE